MLPVVEIGYWLDDSVVRFVPCANPQHLGIGGRRLRNVDPLVYAGKGVAARRPTGNLHRVVVPERLAFIGRVGVVGLASLEIRVHRSFAGADGTHFLVVVRKRVPTAFVSLDAGPNRWRCPSVVPARFHRCWLRLGSFGRPERALLP